MGLFLTSHLSIFRHLEMGAIEIALYYQIHSRLLKKGTLLTNGIFESFSRNAL
jgi:hypothetical protein